MPASERLHQPFTGIEAQDLVRVAIGDEDAAIRCANDVMRLSDLIIAPMAREAAVAIEDHDRMPGTAMRDVHTIVLVHHDIRDEPEGLTGRQPGPATMNRVAAIAQNDRQFLVRDARRGGELRPAATADGMTVRKLRRPTPGGRDLASDIEGHSLRDRVS